jgi:hypothetical protein
MSSNEPEAEPISGLLAVCALDAAGCGLHRSRTAASDLLFALLRAWRDSSENDPLGLGTRQSSNQPMHMTLRSQSAE